MTRMTSNPFPRSKSKHSRREVVNLLRTLLQEADDRRLAFAFNDGLRGQMLGEGIAYQKAINLLQAKDAAE